jgi:hypothetical protein
VAEAEYSLRADLLEPRFWGASELTIWELIGPVDTSAFIVPYPF